MRPWTTTLLLCVACNPTRTVTYYGGGTATVSIEPEGASGISVTTELTGGGTADLEEAADDETACVNYVAVADNAYRAGLGLCAPDVPSQAVGVGLCLDTVDLRVVGNNTDVRLIPGVGGDFVEPWGDFPGYEFPFGTSGGLDATLDLPSDCDGAEETLPHRVEVSWSFDESVLFVHEYKERRGGIPGVGE